MNQDLRLASSGSSGSGAQYAKRQLQMPAMSGELENLESLTLGLFVLQVLRSPLHSGDLSGIAQR
jgi:hypothetical protein